MFEDMTEQPRTGRPTGRARIGQAIGKAPLPHRAATAILRGGRREPKPVFVDPSGARRRRIRRTVYVVGVLLLLALLGLWLSQFLGATHPPAAR
jgi:hypothetical protein